jgi:hypothetical protein
MALIERAGNVQREIDQRVNVNAIDKGGRHVGIGCVDEIVEVHDKSLLPMPSQNTKRDGDKSKGLEQGMQVSSSEMMNGNGVITVSTADNSDAPLSHVDLYLKRPQLFAQAKQVNPNAHPPRQEQARAPVPQGNVFTQLTGKLYSIIDVACNDSYFASPVEDHTAEGWWNGSQALESYSQGTVSGLTDMQVYSKPSKATDQLPRIYDTTKDGTQCAVAQNPSSTLQSINQWHQNQVTIKPSIASSDVWSNLTKQAANHQDEERSTAQNPPLMLQPLNQWHQNQVNLKPSIAPRPMERANACTIEDQGDDEDRVVADDLVEGRAEHHGQARSVEKENRSSTFTKHRMRSSFKKLTTSMFTKFGAKAAIKGSGGSGGGGGGRSSGGGGGGGVIISAPKKSDGPCPANIESRGRLFQLSNGPSSLYET